MAQVAKALDSLIERWFQAYPNESDYPRIAFDPEWRSESELVDSQQEGQVAWRPVIRNPVGDFSNIEHALELELHPDLWILYGRYWSESLALKHPLGELSLIQVWNPADFEYLQQNIIGHLVTKRTMNQQATVFIATTDEDDCNLVMLNASGEVWLEYVGKEPHKKIADNLALFLDSLTVMV